MKAYATILAAAADPNHPYAPFRTILEHLASRTAPTPVLIHCTAGKDSELSAPVWPQSQQCCSSLCLHSHPQQMLLAIGSIGKAN